MQNCGVQGIRLGPETARLCVAVRAFGGVAVRRQYRGWICRRSHRAAFVQLGVSYRILIQIAGKVNQGG